MESTFVRVYRVRSWECSLVRAISKMKRRVGGEHPSPNQVDKENKRRGSRVKYWLPNDVMDDGLGLWRFLSTIESPMKIRPCETDTHD